jgi:3-hydroxymyristoyl/3-hydroxydecanoyl-(acyl carrier protein) dehydratase
MNDLVKLPMGRDAILHHLPHRLPMLMIDSVVSFDDTHIEAVKHTHSNDFYFDGHFPDNPMMPGVIQIETIAQAGALLASLTGKFDKEKFILALASVEKSRFRHAVFPNETLCVFTEIVKQRRNIYKFSGYIKVNDRIVTETSFTATSIAK